jgi:hypothetical protein
MAPYAICALTLAYPAARPEALMRMARHGLRRGDDGRFELKLDPVSVPDIHPRPLLA